ncbi:MAG: glycosyltransferase family 4 protein [Candidatus Vogelbacteria bacterium]|nr:glycosyltransferase family 4 protein [Candidatus Vogelbacteria bacterium]
MIGIIYVVTKGRWGGAQKYVYDLATAAAKHHYQVLVVMGQGHELKEKLTAAGIACRELKGLKREPRLIDDVFAVWQLYRLFRGTKPNIIHLNSSKVGGLGALAGRLYNLQAKSYKLKAKIIFTAHGWAFQEERSAGKRLVIKFLSWLTVLLADQTITVAASEKKIIRHWLGTKNKIITIHNGVRESPRLDRPSARTQLKLAEDQFVIGTIAELTKNKGLAYLILALAKLPNVWLVVIGEGEDRSDLNKLINRLQLTGRVRLVGHLAEAANLLSAFDIFVLPSIKEGLPYVLLEAGLAGLPVVASAVGGIPEIVTSMESGILIKPRRPAEIAKALEFLIARPAQRRKFGSRLRQKIRHDFSTGRMIKQTLAVYTGTQ